MKRHRILGISGLLAVAASAYGFDKVSEHPALPSNIPQQNIVFTPAGEQTMINETATGKVHVLDCPIGDVRLVDQYKVLWPIPIPVPHEFEAICGRDLQGPGTFARTGLGRVVGLDLKKG